MEKIQVIKKFTETGAKERYTYDPDQDIRKYYELAAVINEFIENFEKLTEMPFNAKYFYELVRDVDMQAAKKDFRQKVDDLAFTMPTLTGIRRNFVEAAHDLWEQTATAFYEMIDEILKIRHRDQMHAYSMRLQELRFVDGRVLFDRIDESRIRKKYFNMEEIEKRKKQQEADRQAALRHEKRRGKW